MSSKSLIVTAGLLGCIAVMLGALGAHALKNALTPEQIDSFNTAVRYQMWHALALLALPFLGEKIKGLKLIFWLWLVGVILFSGSIYLLNIDELINQNLSFLGPITPLGGICLIAGWIALIIGALRK